MDKETRLKVLKFLVNYFMEKGEDCFGDSEYLAKQIGMPATEVVVALKILEREGTLKLRSVGRDSAGPAELTPMGLTYFEK